MNKVQSLNLITGVIASAKKQIEEQTPFKVHIIYSLGHSRTSTDVIQTVATYFGVTVKRLKSKSRKPELVRIRLICYVLLRDYMLYSSTRIGKMFNRDHSTILHAYKDFDRIMVEYDEINAGYSHLIKVI